MILLVLVLLVGGSQIPKLARNIGLAGKEFRKAHDDALNDKTPAAATPPAAPLNPAPPAADDKITLSRADLEAILKERDAKVQGEANAN